MRYFIYLSAAATVIGFFYSARSLRRMLYLLFFFSLIEGAFINYFYPRQAPLILKDLLVVWSYGLLIAQGKLRPAIARLGPPAVPIGIFCAIYLLHVFNPELNSLLVGLVGIRVAVFYIPLVFVALVAFDNEEEVWRFIRFSLVLTALVCIYGVFQYFGGATHVAALGPGYVKRGVALLSGVGASGHTFRTLSTFTYSSSFSVFIMVMIPFSWIAYRAALTKRWRWVALATVLLLLAAQISSGGRQALVFTAMCLLLTEVFYQQSLLSRLTGPVMIGAGLLLGFFIFGQEKLSRFESILDVEQVRWRYETYFVRHNLFALETSPLGSGSGAASVAARHVGGTRFVATETAFSKLAYEVGIPGLLAYFWMLGSIIRRARHVLRTARSRRMVLYGRGFVALGIMTFATSFNGWPLDVPPANALFWIFGGIAVATPVLAPSFEPEPEPLLATPPPGAASPLGSAA